MWVYLDGEKVGRLKATDVEELGLQRGAELDATEEREVMRRGQVVEARETCLSLLARRSRSRTELLRRLKTRKIGREIAEVVIGELERLGLVDDREHAQAWADQAMRSGRAGPGAIRARLRQQGVSAEVAREATEAAMAGADEEELARRMAEKRLRALSKVDAETRRRRLYDYLARRGFSHEAIRSAVQALIPTDDD